jgi:hypothetical protein
MTLTPIDLEAGQEYTFQYYMSEGGGGHGYHARWVIPSDTGTYGGPTGGAGYELAPLIPLFDAGNPAAGGITTNQEGAVAAPTAGSFSNIASETATLTFTDNAANEVRYVLELSLTADFASHTDIDLPLVLSTAAGGGTGGATTVNVAGLSPGSNYFARLRGTNYDNASPYLVLPNVQTSALASPRNFKIVLQPNNNIRLDWTDVLPIGANVAIERATDGGAFTALTTVASTAGGGANTYTDTATSPGHSYKYRIQAINGPGGGTSAKVTGNFAPTTYGTTKQVDYGAGFTGPTAGVSAGVPNVVYAGPSMDLNLNGPTAADQANGVPNVGISNPNQLRLTSLNNDEAVSVWSADKVRIDGRWVTAIDLQTSGGSIADGFTFALQNNSNTFVGGGGGAGGYDGIGANAVGVAFDTWQAHSSTGVYTGNNGPTSNDQLNDPATQGIQGAGINLNQGGTGIDFALGHNLRAFITYDGTNLYMEVIDLDDANRTVFQYNYGAIDLATVLGGPSDPNDPLYHSAWIGFTGATGGVNENVDIKSWVYSNTPISATPEVVSTAINDGTPQRSMVKSLSVTFSSPVTTLDAGALKLTRHALNPDGTLTGATSDISSVLNTPTTTDNLTFTWTFAATADSQNGSLTDGVYSYTIDHLKVHGATGTMSADYAGAMFHRLFGDVNGNKTVNNADFTVFRGTFLRSSPDPLYLPAFDFENNGTVNNADFTQFRNRFLKSVVYP